MTPGRRNVFICLTVLFHDEFWAHISQRCRFPLQISCPLLRLRNEHLERNRLNIRTLWSIETICPNMAHIQLYIHIRTQLKNCDLNETSQKNNTHMRNHLFGIAFGIAIIAFATQTASATSAAPDATSMSVLAGIAVIALGAARRFLK